MNAGRPEGVLLNGQTRRGRLLDCMEKNKAKLSGRCNQAIQDVGLKKK